MAGRALSQYTFRTSEEWPCSLLSTNIVQAKRTQLEHTSEWPSPSSWHCCPSQLPERSAGECGHRSPPATPTAVYVDMSTDWLQPEVNHRTMPILFGEAVPVGRHKGTRSLRLSQPCKVLLALGLSNVEHCTTNGIRSEDGTANGPCQHPRFCSLRHRSKQAFLRTHTSVRRCYQQLHMEMALYCHMRNYATFCGGPSRG